MVSKQIEDKMFIEMASYPINIAISLSEITICVSLVIHKEY